jgi:hypothetical protein
MIELKTIKRVDRHFPIITCGDGMQISVQGGNAWYSHPRMYADCKGKDTLGDYTEVEVGFPTKVCFRLLKYAEDKGNPLHTVYGYVPIGVVERVLKKHGGIASVGKWKSEQP